MKFLLALSIVLFALGCGSDDNGGATNRTIALHPLHAEPDISRGGSIVDALDREILLRGVNVNSFAEYWKSRDFPTTFPFLDSDPDLMASIGWNAVRLLLSWSRVEPSPGQYDESYLDEISAAVETLAARGIYTIIDLHQDAWGATLAARPDEICRTGTEPALGWDGAPGWATLDDDQPRCTSLGLRETSPAVRSAWISLWRNDVGPGEVGIRTRYARMVGYIAGRFASNPAVAGYDIMNEPNAFDASELVGLAALYEETLQEIRAAEQGAGGFHHLVLFEPSALWSAVGQGPPLDFSRDDDLVYSPHIYTGGFDGGPIAGSAFEIARDEAALFGGVPVLTGEWGSDPDRASPGGDGYFLDHQRLQDEFRFGATLWTWRESCGDPHKAADYRAGRVPEVWGELEVDCTTNTVVGLRNDLVRQLTRAVLRAAPGRIDSVEYDPATGAFRAGGSTASGGELVIFYPAQKHGRPLLVDSAGLDDVVEHPAPGGNLYLTATASGSSWSVDLQP